MTGSQTDGQPSDGWADVKPTCQADMHCSAGDTAHHVGNRDGHSLASDGAADSPEQVSVSAAISTAAAARRRRGIYTGQKTLILRPINAICRRSEAVFRLHHRPLSSTRPLEYRSVSLSRVLQSAQPLAPVSPIPVLSCQTPTEPD